MQVTREQLAGAVAEVRLHMNHSSGIGDLSSETLADRLLEALRFAPESERAHVTREQLAKAVDGMEIIVDLRGHDVVPGTWTGAKIRYPDSFATEVLNRIAGHPETEAVELADEFARSPAAADPELSAMAQMIAAIEAGADAHTALRALYGLEGEALMRVVRWTLDRYPK